MKSAEVTSYSRDDIDLIDFITDFSLICSYINQVINFRPPARVREGSANFSLRKLSGKGERWD